MSRAAVPCTPPSAPYPQRRGPPTPVVLLLIPAVRTRSKFFNYIMAVGTFNHIVAVFAILWSKAQYRISVDWFLTFQHNPISARVLRDILGWVSSQAIQRIINQVAAERLLHYARQQSDHG